MDDYPDKGCIPGDDPEALEKIVEQFTERLRAGEHPSITEYQDRYPQFKGEIEDLLSSVAMIEQLKSDPSQSCSRIPSALDEVSKLEQIGDYKIKREIGRGGMGIVFEGIHVSLGRRVAIKVMPTPLVNSEKYVGRFKREAQAAARLHHTNIVGVFGVGAGDGFHYYVMDFVDGQTLGEIVTGLKQTSTASKATLVNDETRCDHQPSEMPSTNDAGVADSVFEVDDKPSLLDESVSKGAAEIASRASINSNHFRWVARIGANIADALAYAHDARILHRDIKPANIILDRKGVVWVTDFGLAKDGRHEINLTKTGDVIGTPQYLAPESLQGTYDQRSEVYCLGLTLYELASLKPAYKNGTTAEVIGAIASSSPMPLRKLNKQIPIDFGTIIDKAVARDPNLRYQTAQELQRDLLAYVEDRPISARPPSTIENIIRWSRRNPLAATLAAVSGMLLVLVAISATIGYLYTIDALEKEANNSARLKVQQQQTERQRLAAVDARNRAEDNARKMQTQYDRAEVNIAITIKAFDEVFKQVVSRGSGDSVNIDLDGFEELAGIETSVTREDAVFLDKLLVFYDEFANQNADNEPLLRESARAFRRVANIYQLIGDSKRAIEAYRKSIQGYEQVRTASPGSKEVLISLANTKCELSSLHRRSGQWKEALEQNESAIALLDGIPYDQLDDELKLEMAKTLNSLGSSSALFAALEKTRPGFVEQFYRDLAIRGSRGPGGGRRPPPPGRDGDPRRGNGFDRRNPSPRKPGVGGKNRRLDTLSIGYSSKAIEILDELIEQDPENASYRSTRSNCYCSLAAGLMKTDPTKADEMRDRAIEELEDLIKQDSKNYEYQFRLALACSLGDIESQSRGGEIKLLKKSVDIAQGLKKKFPQFLDYHYLDCFVQIKYAGRLTQEGKFENAFDSLKLALASLEHVSRLSPPDRTYRSTIATLSRQLRLFSVEAEAAGKEQLARDASQLMNQLQKHRGFRPRGR